MKTQIDNFTFYNSDNMVIMKQYPDKYFDLAIVDPPYGIGAGNKNFISGTRVRQSNFHRTNDWDTEIPKKEYWDELFRISKNQIVWGGNYMTDFLRPSRCWIFWDKGTGDNSYADGELAWTSFDKTVRKYFKFWSGGNAKEKGQSDRVHPTQKPVSLYDWIISNYAESGFKIIDTHLGSGSIALAIDKANKLDNMNLEFVGIELDSEYFNAALNRFKLSHLQQTLFTL